MWGISITMCYFHRFIDDINYSLQDFLITFFELLAWIVLIIGAIDTFPQNKYSNKRVWFYYAIMGGFISAIHSFIGLINILEITYCNSCKKVSLSSSSIPTLARTRDLMARQAPSLISKIDKISFLVFLILISTQYTI